MKPRLYFDTSVFGEVYDEAFEEISAFLFEKVKLGKIICVYSVGSQKIDFTILGIKIH